MASFSWLTIRLCNFFCQLSKKSLNADAWLATSDESSALFLSEKLKYAQLFPHSGLNEGMFYSSAEESVKRSSYGDLPPAAINGGNLTEWGKTSPSGDDQQGHTSMYRSDSWVMSTTWDMQLDSTGEEGCRLEPVELTIFHFGWTFTSQHYWALWEPKATLGL